MRKVLHVIFWLALVLWVAAVAAPAIAAATAFTVLPAKGVILPEYSAYFANDPEGMGRMVAGYVADPVFVITDAAQWVLAPLVLLLAIIEWRPLQRFSGPANWFRIGTLAVATALVIHHNGVMAPRMAGELADYRMHAAADEKEQAVMSLDAFNTDHHRAEALFGIRMLLLLCAVAATAACTTHVRTGPGDQA